MRSAGSTTTCRARLITFKTADEKKSLTVCCVRENVRKQMITGKVPPDQLHLRCATHVTTFLFVPFSPKNQTGCPFLPVRQSHFSGLTKRSRRRSRASTRSTRVSAAPQSDTLAQPPRERRIERPSIGWIRVCFARTPRRLVRADRTPRARARRARVQLRDVRRHRVPRR